MQYPLLPRTIPSPTSDMEGKEMREIGSPAPTSPTRSPKSPGSLSPKHRAAVAKKGRTREEIIDLEWKVTNVLADHPGKVMTFCLLMTALMGYIGFGLATFKITNEGGGTWGDIRFKREEARKEYESLVEDSLRAVEEVSPRARQVYRAALTLIFKADGADGLTLENIAFMHGLEWKVTGDRVWTDRYCSLEWTDPGETVWYNSVDRWRFGGNVSSTGGQVYCAAPRSLPFFAYNTRVARCTANCLTSPQYAQCSDSDVVRYPPPVTGCTCTAPSDTCHCSGGNCRCVGCDQVPISMLLANGASAMATGGLEPTVDELRVMLRIWNHQLNFPANYTRAGILGSIFDKNFGSDSPLTETDLTKFHSKYVRAQVTAGNPANHVPLSEVTPACHSRATEQECNTDTRACAWEPPSLGESDSCVWKSSDDAGQNFGKWMQGAGYIDDFNNANGPSELYYFEFDLLFEQFIAILIRDALLAVGSVVFVFLYVQVHTRSFFLATTGFTQVLMPFLNGWFTYRWIFQVKTFWSLSTLALYIVLSIGADDLFVFIDHWREALESNDDETKYMRGRMAWTWKRAGRAMLITSITTMMAFISTMTSQFLNISTFGLFAATLVFWDFVLVMTFFASAVAIHSRRSERTVGCCCLGAGCGGLSCCTCVLCVEVYAVGEDDVRAYNYPDTKPQCGQALRMELKPCETMDDAYRVYGQELVSHDEVVEAKKEQLGVAHGSPVGEEPNTRNHCVLILAAMGMALWLFGYIMLATDRRSGMGFLTWIAVLVVGLILCSFALNLKAMWGQLMQLKYGAGASVSVIHDILAPFVSGVPRGGEGGNYVGGSKMVRFIPTVLLLSFAVAMLGCATQLGPDAGSNQFLPSWHPLQRYFDASQNEMRTSSADEVQKISVLIGVSHRDPVDRSGVDKYDVDSRGTPKWRPIENAGAVLASEQTQTFLLQLCDKVLAYSLRSCDGVSGPCKDRPLQRTLLALNDQNCVMRGFKEWVEGGRYVRTNVTCVESYKDGGCEALTEEEARQFGVPMTPLAFPVSGSVFADELRRYVVLSDRLVKAAKAEATLDFSKAAYFRDGSNGRELQAVMMWFNSSLNPWNEPEGKIRGWYDAWEDFIGELDAVPSSGWVYTAFGGNSPLRDAVMHTTEAYVEMHGQSVMVREAIVGTVVSLSFAFGVVLLATLNPILASFVLLELVGVVSSVLGLIWVIGWRLGEVESISMTILVGLSVDYVVHFAVHYGETTQEERKLKTLETCQGMGTTVLGGAATSAGASVMLVACWMQFFFKFGVFFLLTIGFSYLWAMFVFLPMLSVVGPEGPAHREFGSLRPLLLRGIARIRGKESQQFNDPGTGAVPPHQAGGEMLPPVAQPGAVAAGTMAAASGPTL
eukprot:TRINITY_DN354_c0_g1_i5.p1 TRINITY_DN354_c0_g1~~TRINITY_DN354_c0_g1_i5.p1  ORF type:complete len:1381 (+),score=421.40 TRINITY_DN354_c0_g1_i5:88-4230(+)